MRGHLICGVTLVMIALPAISQTNKNSSVTTGELGGPLSKTEFVERAKRIFRRFDVNHKGFVTRVQMTSIFPDGHEPSGTVRVPFPIRPAPFASIDTNGDQKINLAEYVNFASVVFDSAAGGGKSSINSVDPTAFAKLVSAIR